MSKIDPEAPEEKSFEIQPIFVIQMHKEAKWPYRKKVKCQCTTIILASLVDLPFPMIYATIQPQGILLFGEEDFWSIFPYKCIGKQTWPCRKNVKCQYTTFILAILVDLLSPMTSAKIQPQGILDSGEEDF